MKSSTPCLGSSSVLHCRCDGPPPLFTLPKPPATVSGHGWQALIIAAIVVSLTLLVALITILIIVIIRKRNQNEQKDGNLSDNTDIVTLKITTNYDRNNGMKMENPMYSEQRSSQLLIEELDGPHQAHPHPATADRDASGLGRVNQSGSKQSSSMMDDAVNSNQSDDAGFEQGGSGRLWRRQNWQMQQRGT